MGWLAKACGTKTGMWALASCLLVVSGCGTGIARPPAAAPRVEVAHPRAEKDVEEKDDFIGRMDSVQSVTVQARVFGYLDKILFNDGQMVDVGTPLFEIDPEVYDATYRQDLAQIEIATAELKLAQSKLDRNKALLDKNAITKELYDETVAYREEAAARLDSTKANANRSKLDLEFTKIASPIKGRIDRTFVTKGNLVQGGRPARPN